LAILAEYSIQQLSEILPAKDTLVALDTETTDRDLAVEGFRVVGIGLAWDKECLYLDVNNIADDTKNYLISRLQTYKLIAHNVVFDAAAMLRFARGEPLPWTYCTYGLFKQVATEGYPGQRWGLKSAMTSILGWPEQNDIGLEQWLIDNGYMKRNKTADKSQMYNAPCSILGRYCALDADACWQLYTSIHDQVLIDPRFQDLDIYHTDLFIPNALRIAEQQLRGILVDRSQLSQYRAELCDKLGINRSVWYMSKS
jgi:hypothetical protein